MRLATEVSPGQQTSNVIFLRLGRASAMASLGATSPCWTRPPDCARLRYIVLCCVMLLYHIPYHTILASVKATLLSLHASLRPAIWQRKLLSSPSLGAPNVCFPTRLLPWMNCCSQTPVP